MPKPNERALLIVDLLLRGELTSKEIENNVFGTFGDRNNKRTIQSDIKFISSYFGEKLLTVFKNDTYYYTLITLPHNMYELYTVPPDDIKRVYEFIGLFDADMSALFEEQSPNVIEKIRTEMKQCYAMISKPFEQQENTGTLKTIKKAIKDNRKLSIGYRRNKLEAYNNAIPLKIVFIHNNWHLAILVKDKAYPFTLLRIGHIVSVTIESSRENSSFNETKRVEKANDHVMQLQSPYDSFDKEKYEVKLLVKPEVASYFELKKYLKSQEIKQQSNGSLIVSYHINNDKEILPIIQKWLPNVYVLEPKKLKDKVHNMLLKYIKTESQLSI